MTGAVVHVSQLLVSTMVVASRWWPNEQAYQWSCVLLWAIYLALLAVLLPLLFSIRIHLSVPVGKSITIKGEVEFVLVGKL